MIKKLAVIEQADAMAVPVNQKEKLLNRRKDVLKSISDLKYGQEMRDAQKRKDQPQIKNVQKKIKSAQQVRKGINTQLKSIVRPQKTKV